MQAGQVFLKAFESSLMSTNEVVRCNYAILGKVARESF